MIKNIIFDFDGVILDSVPVKTEAFRKLFSEYNKELVDRFVEYHLKNGGVSRYDKIRYFFNSLLKKSISNEEIVSLANKYSLLTKEKLSDPKYLIYDTLRFIEKNYKRYNMHIASGADEGDLKYICQKLEINNYFKTIEGSPRKKDNIIRGILNRHNYRVDETILIGDSINDFEAARANNIRFCGFGNIALKKYTKCYINSFEEFYQILLL